ncbi:MAG: macro domain-containing protein [Anaerolineaceae bacterium]|nr:macro domain-containing protein [Anaerolineaceae bacterium]
MPFQISLSPHTILMINQGDLTLEDADVIVNAANRHLEHGGGIARAISLNGGPIINEESQRWIAEHGTVPHHSPAVTSAGTLPAKYVFHAVGPIWGSGDEENKLQQAIKGCLQKMDEMNLACITFPAISTGIFRFPKDLAAGIFFETFKAYFSNHPSSSIKEVRLVLFDQPTINAFLQAAQIAFKGT